MATSTGETVSNTAEYPVKVISFVGNLNIQEISVMNLLSVRTDDNGAGTVYYGWGLPGADVTKSVWRISRSTVSGNVTSLLWANGTVDFTNIWNNRASLTYI